MPQVAATIFFFFRSICSRSFFAKTAREVITVLTLRDGFDSAADEWFGARPADVIVLNIP